MESYYIVVIQVNSPNGSQQPARSQFTYKVTHVRPGVNEWLLISKEEWAQAA